MMIIDHVATSILLTRAIPNHTRSNISVIAVIIAGILPDSLVLFYLPGEINYLYHRTFTNSLVLLPIYTFIISTVFYFISKKSVSLVNLFLFCSMSWGLHLLLDLITPYGAASYYPINNKIYSFDILHSFDPFFMSISIVIITVSLINSIFKFGISNKLYVCFMIVYAFYFSFALISKEQHSLLYKNNLKIEYPEARYLTTLPKTFWRWRGIAIESNQLLVIDDDDGFRVRNYEYGNFETLPLTVKRDEYLKKFTSYARFPVYKKYFDKVIAFNAIYSPNSYQLILKIDSDNKIIDRNLSGFDLKDN